MTESGVAEQQPIDPAFDVKAWRARIDSYRDIPFMEDGREQPPMPDNNHELEWD
jgi:hypothetical protein